jgi:hypothetical protein
MQEEVVLCATNDRIQPRHGALHHPCHISHVLGSQIDEISLNLLSDHNIYTPFHTFYPCCDQGLALTKPDAAPTMTLLCRTSGTFPHGYR